jgi:hypothetical protein
MSDRTNNGAGSIRRFSEVVRRAGITASVVVDRVLDIQPLPAETPPASITWLPSAAAASITCPTWCKREHEADLGSVLHHRSIVSEHQTDDGGITVALVWDECRNAELSDPPYILVDCWFGVLQVRPEQAPPLVGALRRAGAPEWLIEDIVDAAAVIAPSPGSAA